MTAYDVVGWCIIASVLLLLWHCPIFKPWFGFRKPKGHPGRWWE